MTGWQAALLPKPFRAWGSLRALPWLWTQISSTSLSWVAGPSAFQLLFSGKRKKSRASHFLWSNWEGGGCVSFTHVPSARTQSYGHMPLQRNQEYSLAGQPCAHKKDNRFGVREHASKPSSDAIRFSSLCSWKEDFRSHTGKSFHLTSGQTKGGLGLPLLLLYDKPSQISWHKMCHYVHAFYVQESRKGTVGPACSSSWGISIQRHRVTQWLGLDSTGGHSFAWLTPGLGGSVDKSVDVWSLHVAFFLTVWHSGWQFLTMFCGVARMTIQRTWQKLHYLLWSILGSHLTSFPLHFFLLLFMGESKIFPDFTCWWEEYQGYNSEEFRGWEKLLQSSLENTICYSGHMHWPQYPLHIQNESFLSQDIQNVIP